MTKKQTQEQSDYEAEQAAEKAAEAKYPTTVADLPTMPERFSTGGGTADEKAEWIKENWPDYKPATAESIKAPYDEAAAKCGPPDGEGNDEY